MFLLNRFNCIKIHWKFKINYISVEHSKKSKLINSIFNIYVIEFHLIQKLYWYKKLIKFDYVNF